jgi:ankyrin repeat protein
MPAFFGRKEMVEKLLDLGADLDLKDNEGRTAVSLAKGQWNQAMVVLLKTFKVITSDFFSGFSREEN